MIRLVYILIFLTFGVHLKSQKVMKVVTRPIAHEYVFENEFLIEIDAEKANIEIVVVKGNTVRLSLRQSAKNVDVRKAEKELTYNHFTQRKERNRLYLRNYVQLEANSKNLTSIINNEYRLEVPAHCHLKIKNQLGNIQVVGVEKSMHFDLNYCSLNINKAKGKLYVDSRIGDITIQDSELSSDFIIDNVSLRVQNSSGTIDLNAQFGDFTCLMSEQLTHINAEVEHCKMTLVNRTSIEFNYAIDIKKASIVALDEILSEKIERNNDDMKLYLKQDKALGTVIIRSEYGDVNLF